VPTLQSPSNSQTHPGISHGGITILLNHQRYTVGLRVLPSEYCETIGRTSRARQLYFTVLTQAMFRRGVHPPRAMMQPPPFLSLPLPLEVGTLKSSYGSGGAL